jgi:hypothetical protein
MSVFDEQIFPTLSLPLSVEVTMSTALSFSTYATLVEGPL